MNAHPRHDSRFGREYHGHLTQQGFEPVRLPYSKQSSRLDHPSEGNKTADVTSRKTSGITASHLPRRSAARNGQSRIPCGICRKLFNASVPKALFTHLGGHFDERYVHHRCERCCINFVSSQDLQNHLLAAKHGSCGFMFEHTQPCAGHHPPRRKERNSVGSGDDRWGTKDDDRFEFCYRIQNWEELQVRAFRQSTAVEPIASEIRQAKPTPTSRLWLGKLIHIFRPRCIKPKMLSQLAAPATSPVTAHFTMSEKTALETASDLENETSSLLGAALLRAICTGSPELVTSLLRAGANTHIADMFGFGPMLYAAHYGSPETINLLIQHGLNVNVVAPSSKTPLGHAVSAGNTELVRAFLRHGAELQSSHLCEAVNTGDSDTAEVLVEQWACEKRSMEVLDHLLRLAVAQRDRHMSQLLLDFGAEPDESNELDCIPLAAAARWRHLALVELLYSKDVVSSVY